MIKLKTKRINDRFVTVKGKYKGNLTELQVDLVAIIADFGTKLAEAGMQKEEIEGMLEAILYASKKHIKHNEEE